MMRAMRRGRLPGWAVASGVILVVVLLSSCVGGDTGSGVVARPATFSDLVLQDEVTTSTTPPTTAASVVSTTAVAGPVTTQPPPPGLGVGAEGPVVLSLERKLETLHYYVGQVDEAYDGNTRDAVLAFQKVTGMERTGRATDDVVAAVQAAKDNPKPLVAAGGFRRVEVDRDRQVMFLYQNNNLEAILNVSTGNNQRFCSEGWCRLAVTPTGAFTIYSKSVGWETGPLGSLYNSQYFNGGIAIHGSRSVPAYPASHGCVRISMSAAEWFPGQVTIGTPVYVVSADEPVPTPVGLDAPPVSTPTTIVAERPATTSTTTPFLSQLLQPTTSTTVRR